jgi:PAS domain-containing protein
MNEATADIFEAETPAQLRGRKPEELYVDGSVRDDLLDRLQETGQVENELVAFETLNGDRRFVRTTITLNEQAENRYVEGILQDVTD